LKPPCSRSAVISFAVSTSCIPKLAEIEDVVAEQRDGARIAVDIVEQECLLEA
jgi:hypothetical protein